jgi:hypothetical protein
MWTHARNDRAGLNSGQAYAVIAVCILGVALCAWRCTRVRTVIGESGIVVHRFWWNASRPWSTIAKIDVTKRPSRIGPPMRYLRIRTRSRRTRIPQSFGALEHAYRVLEAMNRYRPKSVECAVTARDLAM